MPEVPSNDNPAPQVPPAPPPESYMLMAAAQVHAAGRLIKASDHQMSGIESSDDPSAYVESIENWITKNKDSLKQGDRLLGGKEPYMYLDDEHRGEFRFRTIPKSGLTS